MNKTKLSGWYYGALAIIALFAVLLLVRWQALPVFLDIYYHTAVMTGFNEAGGIVLHDFWEYAPAGRPHLYPPLFHLILLALKGAGLPALFTMRIVSAAVYPILLFTIMWVTRRLYDDRRAFWTVLAATLPYTFFINTITAIPAGIALMILVLLFYAIETNRTICGALLMGLIFYTHGGIPWLALFTLVLYALLRREKLKSVLIIISGGIVLGSPWLIHMMLNRSYFSTANSYLNRYFEANIWLYIFAAIGMFIAFKRKGRNLFYITLLLGMSPILKDYAFRFLCGEGLLPVIFLAGIGLDAAYVNIAGFLKEKVRPVIYAVLIPWAIFYFAIFYSPVIFKDGNRFIYEDRGSAFLKFADYDKIKTDTFGASIYYEKYMDELYGIIRANTRPDDIIYCNYDYVAGALYTFSGRAASYGMLNEVRPVYDFDPAVSAALIVWIKNPEGVFDPRLKALIERLKLTEVAETGLAYVYRNPVVIAHKRPVRPIVAAAPAFFMLFVWLAAIFITIIIPKQKDAV